MRDIDSLKAWTKDRDDHGWVMPPAPKWKRLPVIRHLRAAGLSVKVYCEAATWGRVGIRLGRPNQYDLWVLYGIRMGWERDQ